MLAARALVEVAPLDERDAFGRRLREEGLRARMDGSNETLGKRIRGAKLEKIPYVLVVGDKEIEAGSVSVRDREGNEGRGVPFEAFVARAVADDASRALVTADVAELSS